MLFNSNLGFVCEGFPRKNAFDQLLYFCDSNVENKSSSVEIQHPGVELGKARDEIPTLRAQGGGGGWSGALELQEWGCGEWIRSRELRSRRVLPPPAAPQVPAPVQGTHLELRVGTWAQNLPAAPANPGISLPAGQDKDKTALNKRWAELRKAASISLLEMQKSPSLVLWKCTFILMA